MYHKTMHTVLDYRNQVILRLTKMMASNDELLIFIKLNRIFSLLPDMIFSELYGPTSRKHALPGIKPDKPQLTQHAPTVVFPLKEPYISSTNVPWHSKSGHT